MNDRNIESAIVAVYDRLNPNHLDSINKAEGFRELIELLPLSATQIAHIKRGIQAKITEIEERGGSFGPQTVLKLESTLKLLGKKVPALVAAM